MGQVDNMLDGFIHVLMQILTIVWAVGTIGIAVFVGKVWRKQKGY
mgnify:FL=1